MSTQDRYRIGKALRECGADAVPDAAVVAQKVAFTLMYRYHQ